MGQSEHQWQWTSPAARWIESELTRQVEIVDPQSVMLREIANRQITRDDVALTYACAIRQGETDRIQEVNQAILDRWSMNALHYIKDRAWKLVEGGARP